MDLSKYGPAEEAVFNNWMHRCLQKCCLCRHFIPPATSIGIGNMAYWCSESCAKKFERNVNG